MTQESATTATREMTIEEKALFLVNKLQAIIAKNSNVTVGPDGEPLSKLDQIRAMARRMKELSMITDIFEPVMKSLDAEYDNIRKKQLPDLMLEEELRTFTLDGVGRVQLAADCYASIPADQQEAAFEWLRGNKYGDLIKETIHSGTLKSWAKEGLEQGRELPEGMFKVEPFTRASIVKVKAPAAKKAAA